uniref:Uncharacterized protein n=1 Tax=Anthurium amnicola TaxID=1678845 RepID=A0A1D1Z4A9_9ARAE
MEKKPGYGIPATCSVVVFLGLVAISCSVAAEFNKAKEEDLKLDGNLCALPRTPAFGLGVAALVCLSVAQILGTSAVASRLRWKGEKQGTSAPDSRPAAAIALLALSWVSFGLSTVLLGAGTSMNKGQAYGRGWMDGECYVVHSGVYLGSAALAAVTVALIVGFTFAARRAARHRRTGTSHPRMPG